MLAVAQPAGAETPPPEPAIHARLRTGFLSNSDYPRGAERAGDQGVTTIRVTVGTDGRASDCRLWESSGSQLLDQTACGIVTHRFRYTPAEDAAGRPVVEWLVMQFEWTLPRNIRLSEAIPYSQTEPAR